MGGELGAGEEVSGCYVCLVGRLVGLVFGSFFLFFFSREGRRGGDCFTGLEVKDGVDGEIPYRVGRA